MKKEKISKKQAAAIRKQMIAALIKDDKQLGIKSSKIEIKEELNIFMKKYFDVV